MPIIRPEYRGWKAIDEILRSWWSSSSLADFRSQSPQRINRFSIETFLEMSFLKYWRFSAILVIINYFKDYSTFNGLYKYFHKEKCSCQRWKIREIKNVTFNQYTLRWSLCSKRSLKFETFPSFCSMIYFVDNWHTKSQGQKKNRSLFRRKKGPPLPRPHH